MPDPDAPSGLTLKDFIDRARFRGIELRYYEQRGYPILEGSGHLIVAPVEDLDERLTATVVRQLCSVWNLSPTDFGLDDEG